jgi:hypothetical protein
MNLASAKKILGTFDYGSLCVSESEKQAWLESPCTAIFRLACIKELNTVFFHHINAENMNSVCEFRGAIKAILHCMDMPAQIKADDSGSVTPEMSEAIRKAIQEAVDEYGQRGE